MLPKYLFTSKIGLVLYPFSSVADLTYLEDRVVPGSCLIPLVTSFEISWIELEFPIILLRHLFGHSDSPLPSLAVYTIIFTEGQQALLRKVIMKLTFHAFQKLLQWVLLPGNREDRN